MVTPVMGDTGGVISGIFLCAAPSISSCSLFTPASCRQLLAVADSLGYKRSSPSCWTGCVDRACRTRPDGVLFPTRRFSHAPHWNLPRPRRPAVVACPVARRRSGRRPAELQNRRRLHVAVQRQGPDRLGLPRREGQVDGRPDRDARQAHRGQGRHHPRQRKGQGRQGRDQGPVHRQGVQPELQPSAGVSGRLQG